MWECGVSANATCHWKKLLKIRDLLAPVVQNGVWMHSGDGIYTPKCGYLWLLGDLPVFPLAKVIWNRYNTPKNGFLMWLAVQGKLLTRDRLDKWGMMVEDDKCVVCGRAKETKDHLFFSMSV